MENDTCHNDVTGPPGGEPEMMRALKMDFQAHGHLHPGLWSCNGPGCSSAGCLAQGQGDL